MCIRDRAHWLKMFDDIGLEVIVFALVLLSILVLDQQVFGVEPVFGGILGDSFLASHRFWSSALLCIPLVSFDFSGRGGWFSARFPGARPHRLIGFLSIVLASGSTVAPGFSMFDP